MYILHIITIFLVSDFELVYLNTFRSVYETYQTGGKTAGMQGIYCPNLGKTYYLQQGTTDWYQYQIQGIAKSSDGAYKTQFVAQETTGPLSTQNTRVVLQVMLDGSRCRKNITDGYYATKAKMVYTTPWYIQKEYWNNNIGTNRLMLGNKTFIASYTLFFIYLFVCLFISVIATYLDVTQRKKKEMKYFQCMEKKKKSGFDCNRHPFDGYYTVIPRYESLDEYALNGIFFDGLKNDQLNFWESMYEDATWETVMNINSGVCQK
ncbi:hypothetical protein RFI_15152, partial [Reticulomyxa filosa]